MKKVTIITSPEYETILLGSLGKAGVTQLKPVLGTEFEDMQDVFKDIDYKTLLKNLDEYYQELSKLTKGSIKGEMPSPEKMKEIVFHPENKTKEAIEKLDDIIKRIEISRENSDISSDKRARTEMLANEQLNYTEKRNALVRDHNNRKEIIEALKILGNEDATNYLGFGVIDTGYLGKATDKRLKIKPKETLDKLDNIVKKIESEEIKEINGPAELAARELIENEKAEYGEKRRIILEEYNSRKQVIEALRTLGESDQLNILAYAMIDTENISRFEKHLAKGEDVQVKATPISPERSFITLSGPADTKKWIESLFLVFEVNDISAAVKADASTIGNPAKREKIIAEEEKSLSDWVNLLPGAGTFEDRLKQMDVEEEKKVAAEKKALSERKLEGDVKADVDVLKSEVKNLGEISFLHKTLRFACDDKVPIRRSRYFNILQGWTPDNSIDALEKTVSTISKNIGSEIILEIEDADNKDKGVPVQSPKMISFLQPTWRLTTLRGWPVINEINPAYISLFIFCLQFGFMFGDMGQGALFLIIGFVLSRKYKKGMMKKIGALFVPMGLSAIVFGALYGSVFLHEIANPPAWLPQSEAEAHGLYTAILPNPVSKEGTLPLMQIIATLAVVEILFGLLLSSINQIKKKNYIGILGEHGIGMALYVLAVYSAIGPGFTPNIGSTTINLMLAGLACSFIEPIIHGIINGHGFGMQTVSEGIGGLLMTFVEGLSNLFSFLRVAAFALAHASLSVAAVALGNTLGTIPGYLVMNLIAMTFELMSSSVQSMRLLYYEFMGKFFDGSGVPYTPFTLSPGEEEPQSIVPEKVINGTADL